MVLSVAAIVAACGGPGTSLAPTAGPSSPAATGTAAPPSVVPTETACESDTTPDPSVTGELSVYDWSGYDAEIFWQDFKNKYANAKVTFDATGASDADIYNGITTGTHTEDVFHPYTGWLQFYVDGGFVQEIDTSKLKNWCKVPDSFKAIGQFNGKQYFIPWDWGFSSVMYRTDKVPNVDSWSALLDPQYNGHVVMWDDGPGAVTVSSYVHGWDETAITADQLAESKAEWTEVLKNNPTRWLAEPELVDAFQNGDGWLAYSWQGAYATLLGAGVPVAYSNPKEGRNSWIGVYGINAKSTNTDLALKFLDEKLGDLTGNNLVANYYYGTANGDVMASITDETLKEAFSVDDPSILQKTNFTPNLTAEQREAWIAMWSEAKAEAGVQ
jgi:putative spermidine/putrescine transport system substrate-binding protein/spermidine/putrescine transport system substrate-binding protein